MSVSGDLVAGGLVGSASPATIADCYASGSVSGNNRVGGLVGFNGRDASITKCYSVAQVTGITEPGGLLGRNIGMISNSFWDTQTSGLANMCGYQHSVGSGCGDACGNTTAEMQTETTFTSAGWDFVNTWDICEGSYPILRWQIPAGDVRCPDGVNFIDYSFLVAHWLNDNCSMGNYYCEGSDLDQSGMVDLADVGILAENWLVGIAP